MMVPDSRLKRALRQHVRWVRAEERRSAAYIWRAPYRREFLITREQVARYVTSRRTVLFGPDFPLASSDYVIFKLLARLGLRATFVPPSRAPEAVFAWLDTTVTPPAEVQPLVSSYGKVINATCLDIGKEHVETVHQSAFGYGLAVDPRAGGRYLRKSVVNATHDGLVLETATEPEPGYVYQRLLQNRHGKMFEEIRLPYVGGCLPVGMLKLKVEGRRFSGMPGLPDLAAVESEPPSCVANAVPLELLLTAQETRQIDRFATEMGLDCGELDVVRDFEDGRVYVLDVNKTPVGPTVALGPRDMRRYLDAYTAALEALLARFPVT